MTSGSLKKEYVYGAKGLLATIDPTTGTNYTTSDHLGSPRVITSASGAVVSRHDYMPFGEEVCSGVGARTVGIGFCANDGMRQKFTSHERDIETGLDYFIGRYYTSAQGRFTSTDPLSESGRMGLPQSWNRYAYVLNNPATLVDPSGLSDEDAQQKKPQIQTQPEPQPTVIDLRKDKTITSQVDTIRKEAKPLPEGETSELTEVRAIVGDTYNMVNGSYIDGYGNQATGFTGTVRPVAYVGLDQKKNIIEGNGVAVAENVEVVSGDKPQTTTGLAPTPKGGVFIDVQSTRADSQKTLINQTVFVGQFPPTPNTPAKHLFRVGTNVIEKDPKAGKITVTLGTPKQLR